MTRFAGVGDRNMGDALSRGVASIVAAHAIVGDSGVVELGGLPGKCVVTRGAILRSDDVIGRFAGCA